MKGLLLGLLVVDAVLLAAAELLFLPLYWGSVPVPLSALVAAISTPWLVARAADLGGGISVAATPLLAWLVAIGVLGLAGPGHDVLLPPDWRSALLFFAGVGPAVWVLGRVARPD